MTYNRTHAIKVQWKSGSTWQDIDANAILGDVTTNAALSGNTAAPLLFGSAADATCSIPMLRSALPPVTLRPPVRVYAVFDSVEFPLFNGIATGYSGGFTGTLECKGYAEVIRTTRPYSRVFVQRHIATRTSGTSIENPADGGYTGGLLNWIAWQAGGRPYQQALAYPAATFYYDFEQSLIAPRYSWIAGDDAWQEMQRCVQACGGALFQDEQGIIRFRQPLAFGAGTGLFTFHDGIFGALEETLDTTGVYGGTLTVPYQERRIGGWQEVVSDTTPRLVKPGETVVFSLQPRLPLYDLITSGQTCEDGFNVTTLDGRRCSGGTDYQRALDWQAQQVGIVMYNELTEPIVLHKLIMTGRPIEPGEVGVVTRGSGSPQRTQDASDLIQHRTHAQRIADLHLRFNAAPRYVRRATGCPYITSVRLGDTVFVTDAVLGLSAVRHLVTGISPSQGGGICDYDLVPVDDLPSNDSVFIAGRVYADSDTRSLGW